MRNKKESTTELKLNGVPTIKKLLGLEHSNTIYVPVSDAREADDTESCWVSKHFSLSLYLSVPKFVLLLLNFIETIYTVHNLEQPEEIFIFNQKHAKTRLPPASHLGEIERELEDEGGGRGSFWVRYR